MELLPLHKHEGFKSDCIDILNSEWPRSKGARLHSLSKSCDQLPVSLALVQTSKNGTVPKKTVIGFSKISNVQGKQNSCLFESVIIRDEDRGKGFGRILMEMTEQHAKRLGVKTAYLNTIDKIGFYSRLGYLKCKPVVSLGENAHRVPHSMLKHFLQNTDKDTEDLCNGMEKLDTQAESPDQLISTSQANPNTQESSAQSGQDNYTSASLSSNDSTTVSPPPPPPPTLPPQLPPPPPLLPPPANKTSTFVWLDPDQVTWMRKEL